MKLLCAATMALMLATSATAASCTTDQETEITNFLAASVSTSCAASNSWRSSMTFADGLAYDQYRMCQPPCEDDLQNLTSSIPACADDAGTYAKVVQQNQLCIDMTRPTTNGGACTTADAILYDGLLYKEPVWLNCSSVKDTYLDDLRARTTEVAKTLCATATCTAFINAMAELMPNCVSEYGTNLMDKFRSVVGCTPAAVGAYCSMVDLAVKSDAYRARIWDNCSTIFDSTDASAWPIFELDDLLDRGSPEDLPSGFCASTCPANYLATLKPLPSCTDLSSDRVLSDPNLLYRRCPAPTPAPIPTSTPAPTPTPTAASTLPPSCTAYQNATINNFLAAHVSTSCAESRPSWWGSMTFAQGLDYDQYLMCQPPCLSDLQNLTRSIPNCTDDAGTHVKVVKQNQLCTNIIVTRPTTNGGACTSADSTLARKVLDDEPVWLNCSSPFFGSVNARSSHLTAYTTESAKALCDSATCTAFFDSMAKLMPNCIDEYGRKTMDQFRHRFGCTPAAIGANCSMIDLAVRTDAYETFLWSNCSMRYGVKTFGELARNVTYAMTQDNLPSGFCASACPANYLSIKQTLPSCTSIYGDDMSLDPSPLYRICPSLELSPTPAPTPAQTPAPTRAQTPAPTPAPALTCPLSGSYRAMGMRMDLANSGAFTESHDGSGNTCSTTGSYAVSGPMATFTVSTVSGVCGSAFTPNAKLSGPISFSSDCNQLTLSYTGTPSTLQRTSNAETAATSAMLLLGVFLASGAL